MTYPFFTNFFFFGGIFKMNPLTSVHPWLPEWLQTEKVHLMRIRPCEDAMHSHNFFELVYVMHGSALHQLGAQVFRVREGDYFIVDFGSFHRYQENREFEIINCLFAPEYVDRALANCPSLSALLSTQVRQFGVQPLDAPSADRIYHDEEQRVRGWMEAMADEYAARRCGYLEMIRSNLIQTLVYMLRTPAETQRAADRHPAVAAMAEYLYDHYAQPLSLAALADQLGYTPQYLSSLFRKETGMSPNGYVQRLRVERSCRLLAESNRRISEIAQEVGYCDLKHFETIFRRHTNVTPRQFRAGQT